MSIKRSVVFGALCGVLVGGAAAGEGLMTPAAPTDEVDAVAAPDAVLEPGLLVVALKMSGEVLVLDAASGAVLRTVGLGPSGEAGAWGPHEVAVSSDGRTAVVGLYGDAASEGSELVFLRLPDGEVSGRLTLDGYTRPHGLVFVGAGADERLLVTVEAQQSLLVVDPLSREVERAVETRQWGSHMVAAVDGDRAFVSNVGSGSVSVLDLASGELEKVVLAGPGAEGIGVRPGPEGGDVWVANNQSHNINVIDGDTFEVKKSLVCPTIPVRVVFTPDGARALVTSVGTGELVVFDAATYEESGRVDLLSADHYAGTHPHYGTSPIPVGVVVSESGRFAYVSSIAGGYVSVVDLESLEVVRVFDVGTGAGRTGSCLWVRE